MAKKKTAEPLPEEAGSEPTTVWVCLHDGTAYEPGPGRVCPECGSADHHGKAVQPADEQDPEPSEQDGAP
jgi:hypothetical protein